jgi:transcriptional regulator with XRE-family HTH domain
MPRSKTLPAELDPSARQLVTRLRRLKDHSELTMRQLAVKTGYSAKSWERYLGGTSLPPREAVEALARITGTDPVPLLALHVIAADSRDGRRARPAAQQQDEQREREQEQPASPAPPQPGPPAAATARTPPRAPEPAPGRFPHVALIAGIAALAVALSAALLLVLRLDDEAGQAAVAASPRPTAASPPPSTHAASHGSTAAGRRASTRAATPRSSTAPRAPTSPRRSVCCAGQASHPAGSTACSAR